MSLVKHRHSLAADLLIFPKMVIFDFRRHNHFLSYLYGCLPINEAHNAYEVNEGNMNKQLTVKYQK